MREFQIPVTATGVVCIMADSINEALDLATNCDNFDIRDTFRKNITVDRNGEVCVIDQSGEEGYIDLGNSASSTSYIVPIDSSTNPNNIFIAVWVELGEKWEYYKGTFDHKNTEKYPDGYVDYYIVTDDGGSVVRDDYMPANVGLQFKDIYAYDYFKDLI